MAFNRNITSDLEEWKKSPFRKPLVLRGARQVGKTTVIKEFGQTFDTFIYLNLELPGDASIFETDKPLENILQRIYLEKGKQKKGHTLIFIDEIQNSPRAVELMRYFFEDFPDLFVISAGSLLEIMMDSHKISFPVGRVEYRYLFPLTFEEYLGALNETEALELLRTVPLPPWAENHLFNLFHQYALIGGMPEAVARYAQTRDVASLSNVYQGLLSAYKDDVSKYAKTSTEVTVIRHSIESAAYEAGKRITFEHFGNSPFKSREVGNALRMLERAMLVYLLYPSTDTEPPTLPDLKKRPRLQLIDTGLLNFGAGVQANYFTVDDLNDTYHGILTEHIVAQELLSMDTGSLKKPIFWVRELKQSNAEVDFLFSYQNSLIPIEVKSGKEGTLRSLHSFIDLSKTRRAVRLYRGPYSVVSTRTPKGTPYTLINLPYFLCSHIAEYLEL